jgi:hypothetical protein
MDNSVLLIACSLGIVTLGLVTSNMALVSGEPLIQVSPTCGPEDFNIAINANGFEPESNVAWKLVDESQKVPLYGYFATNATGGFLEPTTIDDVPEGNYKIYFGTDTNNDGKFDAPSNVYANLTIPCP